MNAASKPVIACCLSLGVALPACVVSETFDLAETTTTHSGDESCTNHGSCSSSLGTQSSDASSASTGESSATDTQTDSGWLTQPNEAVDLDPSPTSVLYELRAAPSTLRIGGELREVLAYNDQVPGPTLRAKVGDEIVVRYRNDLADPTTIHWHGMEPPWLMDGATFMVDPVEVGETFEARFVAKHAGTFWYHPHVDTETQLDRGLFGAFIVDDPAEPSDLLDLMLVADVWNERTSHETDAPPKRESFANTWLINGQESGRSVEVPPGTNVRLRVLNVSNTGYLALTWPNMRQIASDQGLLSRIENPTQVLLAPGDRAEFEVAVGAEPIPITSTPYTLFGPVAHAENEILVTLSPQAPGLPPAFHEWPLVAKDASPLPPQPDVVYVLQGDSRTETWKINGESFPDVTIERFQAGQPVTIEVRNLSSTEHPFHTHGHAFEVLAENGIPATTYRLEDTINVSIRGTAMLRMLPTELGTWMTHCHILSHSHHMATLYEVYGGKP